MITDELWVEMDQQPGNQVLCTAWSSSGNNGRDQDEPVAICRNQGKGRCFYLVLGHDEPGLENAHTPGSRMGSYRKGYEIRKKEINQ